MEQITPVEEVEVTLASPMRRIAAALINYIFNSIVVVAWFGIYLLRVNNKSIVLLILLIMFGVCAVYGIVQIYFMSKDGQSLGKKIMRIRVLKLDGTNPGFVGTFLIREVAWAILVAVVTLVCTFMYGMSQVVDDMVYLATYLTNVAMLFDVKHDRRTLPDHLAGTVVVALPKRK